MSNQYLKNLWLAMKELGMWQQYNTFEQYEKKELHIKEKIETDRDVKKELNLNKEDSIMFDKMFGA